MIHTDNLSEVVALIQSLIDPRDAKVLFKLGDLEQSGFLKRGSPHSHL